MLERSETQSTHWSMAQPYVPPQHSLPGGDGISFHETMIFLRLFFQGTLIFHSSHAQLLNKEIIVTMPNVKRRILN